MPNSIKREVAYKENTIAYEDELPFPTVLYPYHYGAFLAFSKKEVLKTENIFFCSCHRKAILNFFKMFLKEYSSAEKQYEKGNALLKIAKEFPKIVEDNLRNIIEKEELRLSIDFLLGRLNFRENICHECNQVTPSYEYCVEMYGGVFKRNYGWYIRKQGYEWGVATFDIDFDVCPKEILDLVKIKPQDFFKSLNDHEFRKQYEKQRREIWKILENKVREKLGHKKIGEGWVSETILYHIIEKLFPENTVLHHYRPNLLDGLELDIFIEELNLGIEYQGMQHYKPIKHWGGENGLKKVKARDKKKKKLCEENGIDLVYVDYNEDINEKSIKDKLKSYL